eukprot:scaffold69727_cov62-Phaeocystis_antarctica.AAC.1
MAANIAASTLGNVVGDAYHVFTDDVAQAYSTPYPGAGLIGGYLLAWANGPDAWLGEKAVTAQVMEAEAAKA